MILARKGRRCRWRTAPKSLRRTLWSLALGVVCLAAVSSVALAADGTWTGDTSTDYLTGTNWVGGNVPTAATDVGTFQNPATRTTVVLPGATVSISGFTFNAGAPAFTYTLGAASDLRFLGQGLVNNSSSTQTFNVGNGGSLSFLNNASGDQATISTTGTGVTDFSGLTSGGTTVGSIAGSGSYNLGSNSLTTGSNDASTTVSGVISGVGGSLGKVGTGTLTLSGANTYSGGTTLTAGTLLASNNSAFGTGALTINGGTLQTSGTRTLNNNITAGGSFDVTGSGALTLTGSIGLGGATMNVSRTGNATFSGDISNGTLTKANSGDLTLSGTNTYSGGTTLSGTGTLIAGSDSAFGTGALTINSAGLEADGTRSLSNNVTVGGNFSISGGATDNLTLSGTVDLGGATRTITVTSNGTTNLSGVISNGSINKAGADALTLSGANTYSNTTLSAGTLVAANDLAFGVGTLTIDGGTLQASGTRTLSNSVSVTSNFTIGGAATDNLTLGGAMDLGGATRTLTVSSDGSTTFAGVVSNGSLTKNGNGSLTLSGANTYTDTRINAGTLIAGSDTAFGTGTLTLTTGSTVQASGTRTLSNAVSVIGNFAVGGGATDNLTLGGAMDLGGGTRVVTVDSTGSTVFSGIVSGAGNLTKDGTGSLTLSGANTFNNSRINDGTLIAGNDAAFGVGTLTIDGGTLQASGTRTLTNSVSITDDFAIGGGASDNLTLGGAIALGAATRTITVNSTGSTTFAGVVSGTGDITKAGSGTLTLSGANTYSGDTTVNAGTLQATGGNDRLSTSGTTTINAGGTIDLTGTNQTFATFNGAGNLNNIGTLTVNAGSFSGVIAGTGSLTKATAGSLTLSGANTYSGGSTLSAGTLTVGNDSALSTGALALNGGTFQASGTRSLSNNVTVGGDFSIAGGATDNLTLGGTVNLGGATRTLTVSSAGSTTLSGVVSNGSLSKAGAGSLTLSGANTYSDTTLSTGSLVAANDLAFGVGTLTVSGGTLQASGTRSLTNSVAVGGDFTIGGADNLTLGGTVNLGGATRTLTISNTGSTTLSGVVSNGSLTKAGAETLTLSGANTYTDTSLTAGTLIAGNDAALGTGTLTISDGTTLQASGTRSLGNNVSVSGNFTIGGGATDNLTLGGTVNLGGGTRTLTVDSAGSTTLGGVVSNGSLTKAGTGSLTLSGANTYNNTSLSAGTLIAGNDSALGAGTLTISSGTTLQASGTRTLGNSVTISGDFSIGGGATDNLTLGGAIGIGAATRTITVNSTGSTNFSGVVSGSGDLTKAGTGTLTLSGANTYSGDTTVNAGTLQASGGADRLSDTGVTTINAGGTVDLGGTNQTFATLNGAGNLNNIGGLTVNNGSFTGPISGTGSLTKATAGSLTLSGTNTFSGGTSLSAGTLVAGSNSALGTGTLSISNGTTLQASGARSLSNSVTVGGNFTVSGSDDLTLGGAVDLGGATRTLTISNTGSTTLGGVISNGSLTKAGAESLTLSGANTYTDTTLSAGTLVAGSDTAFGTGTLTIGNNTAVQASGTRTLSNAVTVGGNFAIEGGASDNLTLGGGISLGGATRTITVNSAGSSIFSGVVSGTGSITKAGTGTLTLSGANTYSGNTTVNAGTLAASGGNNRLSTSGNTTINAGGTINLNGNNQDLDQLNGAGNLNNIGAVTIGTGTFSGAISGTGSLSKTVAGTLTLSGANTYSGGTTISNGTTMLGSDSALGTGTLSINGGRIDAVNTRSLSNAVSVGGDFTIGGGATDNLTISGTVNLGGATRTLTVSSSGSTTLGGAISNGSLNKAGTGSLTLSGSSSYSNTTLSAGTLVAASDLAFGVGTLTIDGGTLQASGTHSLANNVSVTSNFAIGGGATDNLTLGGTMDLGGATRTITVNSTGSTTFGGVVSNGDLTKNGTGSLTLSGANTYTDTRINAGTLFAGSDTAFGTGTLTLTTNSALGASGSHSLNNAVTVSGNFAIEGGANDSLTLGGAISIGAGTRTITVNSTGTSILAGNISGGGSIIKAGTGSLTLSGTNTYNNTTLTAGTLIAGNDTPFGTGNLTINGGALQASGTRSLNETVTVGGDFAISGAASDNLTLGGTINLGGATRTITVNSAGTSNLSAVISNGALTKAGTGSLTLSGANTYAGLTTVQAGTLNLTGGVRDTTVSAGGTLTGTGTVTGALNNSGTINPGNSPGTLNVDGSFTQGAGGTLQVEIASPTSYDRIVVTGAPGTASLNGTVAPILSGGYLPRTNQIIPDIITTTGGLTGTFSQIANQRISRTLYWQPLYTSTSFSLQALGRYTFPDLNLSRNQQAVAVMLDRLSSTATGDLADVLEVINSLTTNAQVQNAYNEISIRKYASLASLTFPATHMQFQRLKNRLANWRWESQGLDTGFSPTRPEMRLGQGELLAFNDLDLSGLFTGHKENARDRPWGLYLSPMATWGKQEGTPYQTGFRYLNGGLALGMDYRVSPNLLVGLGAGYYHTSAALGETGGGFQVHTLPVNAYLAFSRNSFYLNGSVGYALNLYNLARNIKFGTINRTARGSTTGNQLSAFAETGYDLKLGKLIVGPTLSLQFTRLWTEAFTEDDAGSLSLKVGRQSAASLQSGVGGRLAYQGKVGKVTVVPQIYASYQHEFANNGRSINAELSQGSTVFPFQTESPKRNFAVVGAGLSARLSKETYAYVSYTAEVGRTNSSAQSLTAGLQIRF
ncbi:MAG: autotransporter-associated beta strand repeat-containing protein [Thermodesulfobacteriota bacterium]